MELATIRVSLTDRWVPTLPDGPAADAAATRVAATWAELRAVASVGAWASTTVQAGRLLELSLRAALVDAGITTTTQATRMSLHELLLAVTQPAATARPRSVNRLTGDTFRALRNLGAHLGAEQRDPDERAATQAIVILVLFVSALHPPPEKPRFQYSAWSSRDAAWMRDNWSDTAPSSVGRWLYQATPRDIATVMGDHPAALFSHGLLGGLGAFKWMAEVALRAPDVKGEFVVFLESQLSEVCIAAAHASALQLRKFFRPLRPLGLQQLDRLLRALMPYGDVWLEEALTGKSPAWLAINMRQWKKANPEQWRRLAATSRREDIAQAAWAGWDGSSSFTANRISLCEVLPASLRGAVVYAAPDEALLDWLPVARPTAAVRTVRHRLKDRTLTDARRQRLYSALMERVRQATISEVRSVPAVLSGTRATEGFLGHAVLTECLSKDPAPGEWAETVQLLWTSWAVSKTAQRHAAARARTLAETRRAPIAEALCLAGIAYLGRLGGPLLDRPSASEVDTWISAEAEAWATKRTRTVVKLAALGTHLVRGAPHPTFIYRLGKIAGLLPTETASNLPHMVDLEEAWEQSEQR